MFLKFITLEGFKSYKVKTRVGKFDSHFNAITGLNGTGKSNILDGIVFVLGLSSLHTVRAQNLNDLINKGGTVKKATVTLVFDNRDRDRAPIGYENISEIIVSRSIEEGNVCKYLLNGINSTKKAVQDLFQSVQLNVNNPNFMIMQGKITKVVNMKPKEILTMLEECVGATTYKQKRDKAIDDVEAKNYEMGQIHDTLQNVILPSVRQHEAALKIYHEFKSADAQRHKLAQEYAVSAFAHYMQLLSKKREKRKELKGMGKSDDDQIVEYNEQISDKIRRREEILKESEKITKEKHAGADKEFKELSNKVAISESSFENAAKGVKSAEVKLTKARKDFATKQKQVAEFGSKSGGLLNEFTELKQEMEEAEARLEASKKRESEINAGKVVGDDGETFDLRERLVVVEDELDKISPEHDHESRLLKGEEKALKDLEVLLSKTPSDKQVESDFKKAHADVERLRESLRKHKINPDNYAASDQLFNAASQRKVQLEQERNRVLGNYHFLDFRYTSPTPNFSPASVHGCLYELFASPNLGQYRDAFEVAAGGSLGVVVVDTDATARAIIKHGNVATRRTYMPLSKVRNAGRVPTQRELDAKVGAGRALCALHLIEFDEQYRDLMAFYFGHTVLCDTMETAKIVAYQMKYKAITVKGDVCDPDGGMQGGTRRNLGQLINTCQQLGKINKELKEVLIRRQELQVQMDAYNKNGHLMHNFETAVRKLKEVTDMRQCTTFATLQTEANTLKESIKTRKEKLAVSGLELAKWSKEKTDLRRILNSLEDEMAKNLKAVKAEIIKWTKALQTAQKKYDSKKSSFDNIETDLKSQQALLDDLRKDIELAEKELEDVTAEAEAKKTAYDEGKLLCQEMEKALDEILEERRIWNEEAEKLEGEVGLLKKKIHKIELGKINRENDLKNAQEQVDATKEVLTQLCDGHPELKLEQNHDASLQPNKKWMECKDALDKAVKKCEDLRKRVDPEVIDKMRETRQMEEDANGRLEILEENKRTLEQSIDYLNNQMRCLVTSAYKTVNIELGQMMSTLLPGATARLQPMTDIENLEDGLSIHVQLGGVWKESLTELSGGQRSLVALSLVLSLCKFQPAPFYIMDEIDAALDLSHTQNIGVLIKQRFRDTQFICVSLKDGMYTNANALFTTSFENGASSVKRFPANTPQDEEDDSVAVAKARRPRPIAIK